MNTLSPQHQAVVNHLVAAYRAGYFPMADTDGRVGLPGGIVWLSPDPRGIMPIREEDGFHIPRRLRSRVRSGRFRITADTAFTEVMEGCAEPRPQEEGTWIDDRFIEAYTAMHHAGLAHSVEAWLDGPDGPRLVGGVYGVHLGAAFFAESKFCRPQDGGTDASKVCLVHLVHHLRRRGFALLDTQFWNAHIGQFGCREIPRDEYLRRLNEALAQERPWAPFEPERTMREV